MHSKIFRRFQIENNGILPQIQLIITNITQLIINIHLNEIIINIILLIYAIISFYITNYLQYYIIEKDRNRPPFTYIRNLYI